MTETDAFTAPESRLHEIDGCLRGGHTKIALLRLEELLVDHPNDPRLHARLANAHFYDEDLAGAESSARWLIDEAPNRADGHIWLSRVYYARKEFDESARHAEAAATLAPESSAAMVLASYAAIQAGRFEDAALFVMRTLDASPANDTAFQLCSLLFDARLFESLEVSANGAEKTAASTRTLVEKFPQSAGAWALRGWALHFREDDENARNAFDRALEIDRRCYAAENGVYALSYNRAGWRRPIYKLLFDLEARQSGLAKKIPHLGWVGFFIVVHSLYSGAEAGFGHSSTFGTIQLLVSWILILAGSSWIVAWTIFLSSREAWSLPFGPKHGLVLGFVTSQVLLGGLMGSAIARTPDLRIEESVALLFTAILVIQHPSAGLARLAMLRGARDRWIGLLVVLAGACCALVLLEWTGPIEALIAGTGILGLARLHYAKQMDEDRQYRESISPLA